MTEFIFESNPLLLPAVMLVVLALAIEIPFRLADVVKRYDPKPDAVYAVQGALLTLTAFVLGLSFSQASARFDARRAVVVQEANAIGMTWQQADQLDPVQTKRFRRILTDDTAARLAAYENPGDEALNVVFPAPR